MKHISRKLSMVLWALSGLVFLLLAFAFGVAVGSRELAFRSRFDSNYFHNFFGAAAHTSSTFGAPPTAHGATGNIIDVSSGTFSMADNDGDEFSVEVPQDAIIRQGTSAVGENDLEVGDVVAVIGAPNGSGQIEARFIRVVGFTEMSGMSSPVSASSQVGNPTP